MTTPLSRARAIRRITDNGEMNRTQAAALVEHAKRLGMLDKDYAPVSVSVTSITSERRSK